MADHPEGDALAAWVQDEKKARREMAEWRKLHQPGECHHQWEEGGNPCCGACPNHEWPCSTAKLLVLLAHRDAQIAAAVDALTAIYQIVSTGQAASRRAGEALIALGVAKAEKGTGNG